MHPCLRLPLRTIALVFCAGLATANPVFAAPENQPAITEVRAEVDVLRITGVDLGASSPRATLGTMALVIVSVTATQVEALLPAGIAPGGYLLTLAYGKGKKDYDEFWVTIGAVGAQGPAGKEGARGSDGATGPVGKDGPQGPSGRDGATGPTGKDGATGPTGKDGAPGPPGNNGAVGPTGAAGAVGAVGPPGPQGPVGAGGTPRTPVVREVRHRQPTDAAYSLISVEAVCPVGSVLTGGSAVFLGYEPVGNAPINGNNLWAAHALTPTTPYNQFERIEVSAICLRFL